MKVKNITIVGGGTAGVISALILDKKPQVVDANVETTGVEPSAILGGVNK